MWREALPELGLKGQVQSLREAWQKQQCGQRTERRGRCSYRGHEGGRPGVPHAWLPLSLGIPQKTRDPSHS